MKLTEKINSITNNLCFLNSLKDELSPKIKTIYDFQMSGMYFIKFTKLGSQHWTGSYSVLIKEALKHLILNFSLGLS